MPIETRVAPLPSLTVLGVVELAVGLIELVCVRRWVGVVTRTSPPHRGSPLGSGKVLFWHGWLLLDCANSCLSLPHGGVCLNSPGRRACRVVSSVVGLVNVCEGSLSSTVQNPLLNLLIVELATVGECERIREQTEDFIGYLLPC